MQIKCLSEGAFNNHLNNLYYLNDSIDDLLISELLSSFVNMNNIQTIPLPLLYIIDYTKAEYICMTQASKLITGYDSREFLEGGIPFLLDIYNKDDFKIYNQFIFKENIDFLKNTPNTNHNNYFFSYNFRVKNTKGNFIPIFQQGYYFTSPETNLPLLSIGSVIDISAFKRDSLIYHNIQEITIENNSIVKSDIKQNCYNPDIEKVNLSRQELHILKYIADGFSIKQIADKLKISTNTVANHRKNMFKKTNTKNMAELVRLGCDMKFIN